MKKEFHKSARSVWQEWNTAEFKFHYLMPERPPWEGRGEREGRDVEEKKKEKDYGCGVGEKKEED